MKINLSIVIIRRNKLYDYIIKGKPVLGKLASFILYILFIDFLG